MQAGSVFSRIAERIYAKYLYRDPATIKDSTSILIPDVKNGDLIETAYVLRTLNIPGNSKTVPYAHNPLWGKAECTRSSADLKKVTPGKNLVPNVRGMGAKDAVYLLESHGLRVRLDGMGKVREQSIAAGSTLHKGQTITLTLKN